MFCKHNIQLHGMALGYRDNYTFTPLGSRVQDSKTSNELSPNKSA
jgi:hypothetical protein